MLDPTAFEDKVDVVLVLHHLAHIENGEFDLHVCEIDHGGLAIDGAIDHNLALVVCTTCHLIAEESPAVVA